jgi:hypothetical protein
LLGEEFAEGGMKQLTVVAQALGDLARKELAHNQPLQVTPDDHDLGLGVDGLVLRPGVIALAIDLDEALGVERRHRAAAISHTNHRVVPLPGGLVCGCYAHSFFGQCLS